MNAVLLEQTASHLTRQTLRWDRRLRLIRSLIWIPRGLIVGLLVGVAVAVISRLRPWFLPEQIVVIAVAALVIGGAGIAALIWLWPRSTAYQARYFDHRFGLKERISTALELIGGAIPLPDHLAEHQLTDAVNAARRVDVVARLPLRFRWQELVAVIGLALLLVYLLMADNPQAAELRAQRNLENAINEQAANLDATIQDIENNPALSDEEKDALTQPLEQAQNILQQPGVSQEEAVAAMAEASQSLKDLSDGMNSNQEAAYQQAANQLANSPAAQDMADAMQKPDLGETANSMDELADKLGEQQLSEQERQDLANALEQAANEIEQNNPALAEKLREAAKALREGDIEAAQKALREAAELARQQQQQLDTGPMAQAAQQASQQVDENQRDLAQAGQQPSGQTRDSNRPPTREGDNPPAGLTPKEQTGDQASDQNQQPGQGGDQSQPGQGENAQPGQGQMQQSQGEAQSQAGETQGEGETQPGGGAANTGEQQGAGGEGAQTTQGQPNTGDAAQSQGSLSAGTGEGGAGTDSTIGTETGAGPGEIPSNNTPGEGTLQEYNPLYHPSTIGGESSQTVDIGGNSTGQEGQVVQEGDFGPNPQGVSMLSYSGIFGRYQNIVSDALASGRIPLDQRDVIHDYFSSLEPAQ